MNQEEKKPKKTNVEEIPGLYDAEDRDASPRDKKSPSTQQSSKMKQSPNLNNAGNEDSPTEDESTSHHPSPGGGSVSEARNSRTTTTTAPGAVAVAGMHSHLYAAGADDQSASSSSSSMPISGAAAATTSPPPLIEATLVQDEETAEKVSSLPATEGQVIDTRKWRNRIIGVVVLVILAVAGLVAGLVVSNRNDESGSLPPPGDPLPFENSEELWIAVTAYLNDPTETSSVARTYGYPLNTWQVERVTDFSNLFSVLRVNGELLQNFNEPLDNWNTSGAINMAFMFAGCVAFNQSLPSWDTSQVQNMTQMFNGCLLFEGEGLETWDTGSVETFEGSFVSTPNMNADLSKWDVSSCTDFDFMFQDATSFCQDLSQWNVGQATSMVGMFWGAQSFDSDLANWNVASVTSMSSMFRESAFSRDISLWEVGAVDSFGSMFRNVQHYNHSLCAWGPPLQQRYLDDGVQSRAANTENMFQNTSCPDPRDPNIRLDPAGPFCHDCTSNDGGTGGDPVPLAPRNDVCTGAIPISWTARPDLAENFLLFQSGGVTLLANPDTIPGCTPDPPSPGVWFSALGTGDTMEAVTCFGAFFDTYISVASGSSCTNLTCVAFAELGCSVSDTGSAVSWNSTEGEMYYIHVGGATASSTGSFNLVVTSYDEVLLPP